MDLASRLRQLRGERGLKQKFVAEKLGIGATVLAKYESGEREPNLGTLVKLATFYNVSVDYIIGATDFSAAPLNVDLEPAEYGDKFYIVPSPDGQLVYIHNFTKSSGSSVGTISTETLVDLFASMYGEQFKNALGGKEETLKYTINKLKQKYNDNA